MVTCAEALNAATGTLRVAVCQLFRVADEKGMMLYWFDPTQAEINELLLGTSVVMFVQYLKERIPFAVAGWPKLHVSDHWP
jgi:hypothetical protein